MPSKKSNVRRRRIPVSSIALPEKIVVGFWHNWVMEPGGGYSQGHAAQPLLNEIPAEYNVICVAFMKDLGEGFPDFRPDAQLYPNELDFRAHVAQLNAEGRPVLISLGGADAHISLRSGQEEELKQRIIDVVDDYGFNGLDIDLEQTAINEADNETVLPAALRLVKDHYRAQGKNFIIGMAPEIPYLTKEGANGGVTYQAYLDGLDGYYDYISPQFYNQGGWGFGFMNGEWPEGGWLQLSLNNPAHREDLFYFAAKFLNTPTGDGESPEFLHIPHDKLAFGLPSNGDGANPANYFEGETAVLDAMQRLEDDGTPIKGVMTWSINWDNGRTKSNVPYDWRFIKQYGHIGSGGGTAPEKPSVPTGLTSPQQTETSISLQWQAASGPNPISYYTLYRNGTEIGRPTSLTFTDSGLLAGTEYQYSISATDNKGNSSARSVVYAARTKAGAVAEWQVNALYEIGTQVQYQSQTYRCVARHTSNNFWTPDKATTLWQSTVIAPLHAYVTRPKSRALIARETGIIDVPIYGGVNQLEAGKFFPETEADLLDPGAGAAQGPGGEDWNDVKNRVPPVDGYIASGNRGLPINPDTGEAQDDYASYTVLDEARPNWFKHKVNKGERFSFEWTYSAPHKSRRWNYFITKANWDPTQKLSRAQFETTPFYTVELQAVPYWTSATDELDPMKSLVHNFNLPERTGYHVLLAVWEVADTAAAFYQVIDLHFTNDVVRPTAPSALTARPSETSVALSWTASTGDVAKYRIIRSDKNNNPVTFETIDTGTTFIDSTVRPNTTYLYYVCAIDRNGNESAFTDSVKIVTVGNGNEEPPLPPASLHVMSTTTNSIQIMWSKPNGSSPISRYIVYRGKDGQELARVDGSKTDWTEQNLLPGTTYHYGVRSLGENGELSDWATVEGQTNQDGGSDIPPTAPRNLSSPGATPNSINLAWNASTAQNTITNYIVYRDGVEVSRVAGTQLSYQDTGLSAETAYRYFVAALDNRGLLSVPSNVLDVTTLGGGGGDIEDWQLDTRYEVNDLVRYNGKVYKCFQAHTSNSGWTPEGTEGILWLLQPGRR